MAWNQRGTRCIKCGCFCRLIGLVPPKTVECKACGKVFRLTKENIRRMPNWVDRDETNESRDKYPSYLRPNLKKISGER